MEVFRITKEKYAHQFFAPGVPGRWNKKGEEVIYTASSRSLACLENMVHGSGGKATYRTMVIHVPDALAVEEIRSKDLPDQWNLISLSPICQEIGSAWYHLKKAAVLKVPSSVIPEEFNFVLNSRHPEFNEIKLVDIVPFFFDKRIK